MSGPATRTKRKWLPWLLGLALFASLLLNLSMAWGAIDTGFTLAYTQDSLDHTQRNELAALVVCNAALSGADKEQILETARAEGVNVLLKTPEDIFAENLALDFAEDRLVSIRDYDSFEGLDLED